MKKKTVTTETFELMTALAAKGYWPDSIGLDKGIIQNKRCPHCSLNLVYKGFSNLLHYKAFGVCELCEKAKLFWTEVAVIAVGKKRVSRRAEVKA